MSRIVLTDQDLTGQTLKGLPFSYIGRCTGTDIKFVGDWTNASFYQNDFLRPDWSKAQTRYSYSRFNTFTDAVTSGDMNTDDHDMLLAAIDEALPKLTGVGREAMAKAGKLLRDDIAEGLYLISWAKVAPVFLETFDGDFQAALETAMVAAKGKQQLVNRMSRMAFEAADTPCWAEPTPPTRSAEGVSVTLWGVLARNTKGKEYRRHWSELPTPTNPHDRLEMAELIEAEVLAATGLTVSIYIHSILHWNASSMPGTHDRDWFTKRTGE